MYEHTLVVRFPDIDYAGRVFYGKVFEYVHEAEEEFFADVGYSIRRQRDELDTMLPVVDVSAEFHEPMYLEDQLTISLEISEMGEKSLKLSAVTLGEQGTCVFDVDVTRVCMDESTERAVPIPDPLRAVFESHVQ
jgi:YbgC/YbaW family acyl-CoA thioester hydrolase